MRNLFVILLILIISEKLCMILAAFLFGCIICLKYLSIKLKKNEIHEFFSSYKKNMAQAIDEISKSLENIKLTKDNFLGKDLPIERNFCDAVSKLIAKELKDCEVSTFFGKKITSICCKRLF